MRNQRSLWVALLAAASLLFAACSEDPDLNDLNNMTEPGDGETDGDVDGDGDGEPQPDRRTTDCDALQEAHCLLPWPSNLYLEADASRATGYTLGFGETSLPASRSQGHSDPQPWRRLDGYGWGTPVITLFPEVDISEMPQEDSIERSMELLDEGRQAFYFQVTEQGLEPVPFWAELDLWTDEPDEKVLYLRPGVILEGNTRYVVGFRNLRTLSGEEIAPSAAFQSYLSGEGANDPELAWRQARFDEIFTLLEEAGIARDELTLAWDFHTGSSDGLHSTLLHVVKEGIDWADENGMPIDIRSVTVNTREEDSNIALDIRGFLEVPHFLEHSPRSGAQVSYLFYRGDDGKPAVKDTRRAEFWLLIPHDALEGVPHGLVKYGHGMLGRGSQVRGGFNRRIAAAHNLIFFGADFTGFSEDDVAQAIFALGYSTYFEEMIDRMHQGVLEYVLLTKAMREGLASLPELEEYNLEIDLDRVYYSGISQGGIFGVTYLAVDPHVQFGHFGVPGHNYAMMMERSSNFNLYYQAMRAGYSERIDQSLTIPIVQLLWDQVDPISYLSKLSHDPFDPDFPKYGLFTTAKGDYQVAVVTKEITARSNIGIPLLENYDREREPYGVQWATYPRRGSGIVNWDFGNPWPAIGNLPPNDGLSDPHGFARQRENHNNQMVHFFDSDGEIIDVCGGEPCYYNMFE